MTTTPGLTVEEIADLHDLDPNKVYRWAVNSSEWMGAIVSMDPVRYDSEWVPGLIRRSQQQDQKPSENPGHTGLTVREIATKYRVSMETLHRWIRDGGQDNQWKQAVVGRRGTAQEYDARLVDELVRERIWLPPRDTDIPPDEPLTMEQIAEYTGIPYRDVRLMAMSQSESRSKHTLGEPDDKVGHQKVWFRRTVDQRVRGRQRRKKRS